MTSTELRTFASIVCRDCLYLEFPGCDSHQLLYTESILDGTTVHAKCPKCTAATNNQRPFREGCRRCKGKTVIRMWNSCAKEISQAFRFFPPRVEEIDHTVLQCDEKCCASVVFPSSREVLTTRTAACQLVTSSNRQLKVSNFQLSMPHVSGCPRQGMPLQAVPVRLPKSELKFVLERIDQCPLPEVIAMGPVYRRRQLAPPSDTNQLHQIYLRLLTTIIKTFDSHSLKALEPLKQISLIFSKPDALRMFQDWAPPSASPFTHIPPTQAFATSAADEQAHDSSQQAVKLTHVKIVMTNSSSNDSNAVFGIQELRAYPTTTKEYYTPPNQLLQDLFAWISSATQSPHQPIREVALAILQKLALVSGSLCGLLHVVYSLLHSEDELSSADMDNFLVQLSQCAQKVMMRSNTTADNAKIEKRIIQQMSLSLQDEVTRRTIQILQNIPGLEVYSGAQATPAAANDDNSRSEVSPPVDSMPIHSDLEANTYPVLVMLLCQQSFLKCIQSKTQLAMVVLSMLSELSVWQMQRMQRPEDFVGRREEELSRLEDPFSIQVCPELFSLCYELLRGLLAPWLDPTRTDLYRKVSEASTHFGQALANSSQPFEPRFAPNSMGLSVLQIITANVRRLVLSHVNPAEVGLEGQDPMIQALEHLISLGTKRTDPLFPLSLQAAAAIEVGMEAFYPSSQQRTNLLTTRMGQGATLEFQLRWPVQEREQEDPRYERLILLLQLACIKQKYEHALRGTWNVFLHLVIQLPQEQSTSGVLHQVIAECIQQAGFAAWQVVAGAQEISITLQRHLHWNRIEKMSHDSGSGWIRVYPRAVASYDEVLTEVNAFVDQHANLNA